MQKNITGFRNEIEKLKKDLKNEKMERPKEAQYRQNDKHPTQER